MSDRVVEKCRSWLHNYTDIQIAIQSVHDEYTLVVINLFDDFEVESIGELIIDNLHDIRLIPCPTPDHQWNDFQEFFYRLIQQSNGVNTLRCIISLCREHLSYLNRLHQHKSQRQYTRRTGESYGWIKCLPLKSWDDLPVLFPKQCHIVTCNFHHSQEQSTKVLTKLEMKLPDIICLQGCSKNFLDELFETKWIRANDYSFLMQPPSLEQSNGQIILMKRFRPKNYSTYHLESSDWMQVEFAIDDNEKMHIIYLYGLECTLPDTLFETMKNENYLLIGHLSYDQMKREHCSNHQLNDLWKQYEDSDQVKESDQFLFHKLFNLKYSIDEIRQYDGSSSQLLIRFEVRSISYLSALAIVSERNREMIIPIISPFFSFNQTDDDIDSIVLPLRWYLSEQESFEVQFHESIDERSKTRIEQLQRDIQQLFSPFQLNVPSVNFHDSIISLTTATTTKLIQFKVQQLSILKFDEIKDRPSFMITYQIPFGPMLEPIGRNPSDHRIHSDLAGFFTQMNLYPEPMTYEQKQEKLSRLLQSIDEFFMIHPIEYFNYLLLPYGSHRLGLHGDDLDLVLVITEKECSTEPTDFDRSILQQTFSIYTLKDDLLNQIEQHLKKILQKEIQSCRKISALHPLISIIFTDRTKVELAIQIRFQPINNATTSIHGVSDCEWLLVYARCSTIFQHLLTFIRRWAQQVGLYGQVYGYLGGVSWAILCAHICHEYLTNINDPYTFNEFSLLVEQFFSSFSTFDWENQPFSLHSTSCQSTDDLEQYEFINRGAMSIYCPTPPYPNSTRSTIRSTIDLFVEALKNRSSLPSLLHQTSLFPHERIQSLIELRLLAKDLAELDAWTGWLKSRLARFLTDCENDCQWFIQSQSKIEKRDKENERYFSIGFSQQATALLKNRDFRLCLDHFLDQFRTCPYHTQTMKFFYKLIAVSDRSVVSVPGRVE